MHLFDKMVMKLQRLEYLPYVEEVLSKFPMKNVILINLFDKFKALDLSTLFTLKSPGNETVGIKPGEIDFLHTNILGNAYIAESYLKEGFNVHFDVSTYMNELQGNVMLPAYL